MSKSAAARDRFVVLDGLRLHYREWGSEDAPPLILLHGWSSHAYYWDDLAEAMADRYRVLALDQRGHGESAWAQEWETYGIRYRVADLERLVAALALPRITLVGHSSMGSVPSYHYAAAHPDDVERLVIEDYVPALPPGVAAPSAQAASLGNTPVRSADSFESPDAFFAEMLPHPAYQWTREDRLRRWLDCNVMQRPDGRWTLRFDARLRSPQGYNIPRHDPAEDWAALERVTCPTLIVRGAEGPFSRESVERMAGTVANGRVVEIPSAGHWVLTDNPTDYVSAVQPFLLGEGA